MLLGDMDKSIKTILDSLQKRKASLSSLLESVLANLVMIGEIPAPTFNEENRIKFLCNRLSECGLQNCSTDEKGNGFGILPGKHLVSDKNILVVAHADTLVSKEIDHTISIQPDKITGPGLGDNSLGLAVIATLPTIFDQLNIQLESNLILMGSVKGLGKGDLEGLRFFLRNNSLPIQAGVSLEGVQLGRLSYNSLGMFRGEIACIVPDEYDWTQFGASGAIITLNDLIGKINSIPIPRRPRTAILLGSIRGGTAYNTLATRSLLCFEVRSESAEIVNDIENQIHDIVTEMAYQSRAEISMNIFARRQPGGILFRHPLVETMREIMKTLDIQPRITPSISELSAFIDHNIPAVTLGITRGERSDEICETIQIEPMFTGLAQLIGALLAIDCGVCDEKQ